MEYGFYVPTRTMLLGPSRDAKAYFLPFFLAGSEDLADDAALLSCFLTSRFEMSRLSSTLPAPCRTHTKPDLMILACKLRTCKLRPPHMITKLT